jgi:hypothetical protein
VTSNNEKEYHPSHTPPCLWGHQVRLQIVMTKVAVQTLEVAAAVVVVVQQMAEAVTVLEDRRERDCFETCSKMASAEILS